MIFKTEKFDGPFLPFEAEEFVPAGSIVGGQNVRRIGLAGGWEGRLGYTLINTTSIGSAILSLFRYTNPIWGDYHLIVQTGGNLRDNTIAVDELMTQDGYVLTAQGGQALLARSSGDPLEQVANLGDSIFSSAGATPGFYAVIGEDLVYGDGSGRPVVFGGDAPSCDGFLVNDTAINSYNDYTKVVANPNNSNYAIIPASATVNYYVGAKEPVSTIDLTFGSSRNTNAVTPTVYAWRSGSWTNASASDGTSGSETHDTDGSLTWTAGSDEMRVIGGRQLYWYKVTFSGAPTVIHVNSCRVTRAAARMTNKWDGEYRYPTGAMFYDGSETSFKDLLGLVSNASESQYMDLSSATTSDFVYVKAPEKFLGVGFAVVQGSENSNAAVIDAVEGWDGDSWNSLSFTDTTKNSGGTISFAQHGTVWIDQAELSSVKRTLGGDGSPGHWIRISWDAALSSDVKIATILYASWPEAIPTIDGVIEYNGRGVYWGPFEYQNRLLISPYNKPDQLAELSDSYSPPFGDSEVIKSCVVLGEYLLVLKEKGVFVMWEESGSFQNKQLTSSVGISSPKSLAVAELGESNLKKEEVIPTAIWEDLDGFYKTSTTGNILKISEAIKNYYDPNEDEYIGEENMGFTQGYICPLDGTYRAIVLDYDPSLGIADTFTLVYNVKRSEWYPPWYYSMAPRCVIVTKGTDNKYVVLGGTTEGHLIYMENGLTDRNSSNVAYSIDQRVLSRVMEVAEKESDISLVGTLRQLWAEMGTLSTGSSYTSVYVYLYINRESSSSAYLTYDAADNDRAVTVLHGDYSRPGVYAIQLSIQTPTESTSISGDPPNLRLTRLGFAFKPQRLIGT